MIEPDFTATIFHKTYGRVGPLAGARQLAMNVRHNLTGDGLIEVDAKTQRVDALATPGCRVVMEYYPDKADRSNKISMSGIVNELDGEGIRARGVRTFLVQDDWADVFNQTAGWPNPTGTISQQGDDTAYFTRTGHAETVLRQIVGPNMTRTGKVLTLLTDGGRGSTITVSIRMHPLSDRLFPAVDQAGIGVRVIQSGTTRNLEVYEPATHTRAITEGSGIILTKKFSLTAPEFTRVIIGAGGEGTARLFKVYIDTAAEALWGIKRETFQDARDIALDDPNVTALMDERGAQALLDLGAKTSLSITTTETDVWRLGKTFQLGDRVPVQLDGAPALIDAVREVGISRSRDAGIRVTPIIGDWATTANARMNKTVAQIAKGLRDLQRR